MATDGATARGFLLELEGPIFDGRFRVEERIAEGGFAVVYKAWQLALERRVALKVLKPPRNRDAAGRAEFRERFAAEAKTIARLRHPDIVDVYDFSVAALASGELAPWMALEWLDGETLALELGRRRRAGARGRDPAAAIELLRPVMRALAHAHEQGIVHRDIKPSNIMVTATPGGPSVRVLDFGIAKIMVDTHAPNTGNTRTESLPVFSPAYAAPEQVAFSRTGPWTDVHALGLVLTEVMTDEAPFSDPDPEAHFFEQVMAARRPTPASKGIDVGPFEPILARALALSPRDRWRSAGELMAALDQARVERAAGAVAVALEPGGTERGSSSMHAAAPAAGARRGILAVAVVAALLVVGAAWTRATRPGESLPRRAVPTMASEVAVMPGARVTTPTGVVTPSSPTAARAGVVLSHPKVPGSEPGSGHGSGPGPSVTLDPATPKSAPRRRKRQRLAVGLAADVLKAGDGRELFNDTK